MADYLSRHHSFGFMDFRTLTSLASHIKSLMDYPPVQKAAMIKAVQLVGLLFCFDMV
jgi:hypothetical protein